MELHEFARRVLFAESLEEKLAAPDDAVTDESPGPAILTPDSPGRPPALRVARRGERADLPPEQELHREEHRAVLFHFFANHELLATELMALAILKFPDAPRAFRRALLQTLREEQEHTRLYMQHMARGGMTFGDLPVNGFFWRHVSGMESPLDYVSRLSLTFEQANLDFSHHFAQLFGKMGDTETAALMQRIYEDEIGHVGCGLRWLRKWKQPGDSDFDAWRKVLRFPLSPARARGTVPFNAAGRRRAGLDEAFISSVEIAAQSRGRTPDVHLFNPGAERCALTRDPDAGKSERATSGLARDLDLLPLLVCHADDVVLVQRAPSQEHLLALKAAGIVPAELEVLDPSGRLAKASPLRTRKLRHLRPWGWSSDSAEVFAPIARTAVPWNDAVRKLYSKATAARLLAALPHESAALAGSVCENMDAARDSIAAWFHKGHAAVLLKAPWGLAGRGILKVQPGPLPDAQSEWLRSVLAEQGSVVVEPCLDRVADFSAHYDVVPGELPKLRGMVRLVNDSGGRFIACVAAGRFGSLLPPEAARALHEGSGQQMFENVLPQHLASVIGSSGFRGWLGVDAFVHRDAGGRAALRPVVEINPRCTMGRATLEARRFAAPDATVAWRIFYHRHVRAAGLRSLTEFARDLRTRHPLVLKHGRIASGAVILNDPAAAETFLGVLFVGEAAMCLTQKS
jgi:uncharacterized ferritin-like protein (DUF455 family)